MVLWIGISWESFEITHQCPLQVTLCPSSSPSYKKQPALALSITTAKQLEDTYNKHVTSTRCNVCFLSINLACKCEQRTSSYYRGVHILCCNNFYFDLNCCFQQLTATRHCDGWESNPGQLLGRQLCSPLYHHRSDTPENRYHLRQRQAPRFDKLILW